MLNVVNSELIKHHKLTATHRPRVKLKFGGGHEIQVNQSIVLTLSQRGYKKKIEFLVAAIHVPIILGTPWFSSISIANLTWKDRILKFSDMQTKELFSFSPFSPEVVEISFLEFEEQLENHEFEDWGLIFISELMESKNIADCDVGDLGERNRLDILLDEYEDIFQKPTIPPPSRPEDHKIDLVPNSKIPTVRSIGRLSEEKLQVLKHSIQEMMEKGFIRPSNSPFGASVLFAKKPDGSLRLCIDYRGLNDITLKDKSPLPHLGELRDRVAGAGFFSTMDLRDGFYNILVKEEDRYKRI
jgi:hypothetical protein